MAAAPLALLALSVMDVAENTAGWVCQQLTQLSVT